MIPALHTSTSTSPICRNAASTCSRLDTSQQMAVAPVFSATARAAAWLERYKKKTRQPWAANRSTAAAPMPREPPVITTVSIKESFLKKTGCKQPVQRFKCLTEFAARGGK